MPTDEQTGPVSQAERNADYDAIHHFSQLMGNKMLESARKGRRGWRGCPVDELRRMLVEHIAKGDMVDVALIAMMIEHNARVHPPALQPGATDAGGGG